MKPSFSIEVVDWIACGTEAPEDRATAASLRMTVGGEPLTVVEDRAACTVRDHVHVSAYAMAYWLAENWWRLLHEPEAPDRAGWPMAHHMAGIGAGYLWPPLVVYGDGQQVTLAWPPVIADATFGSVRYLPRPEQTIPRSAFEAGVDQFVDLVLARLAAVGRPDSALGDLWRELRAERDAPAIARLRRLEALLGADAGEGEAQVRPLLARDEAFGEEAVDELAAASTGQPLEGEIEALERLASAPLATVPELGALRAAHREFDDPSTAPWRLGERLAVEARRIWKLAARPLTNRKLAEMTRFPERALDDPQAFGHRGLAQAAALRTIVRGQFACALSGAAPESRRFHFARLLLDDIVSAEEGRLLLATRSKTRRQKIQRAFAAELLCPFEALRAELPAQPDDDDLIQVARAFGVSPLLVRSSLVNKGLLERDRLVA